MSTRSESIPIAQAVIDGHPDEVVRLVTAAIEADREPKEVLNELVLGIREVGDRFGSGEFYLPDLMIGANAMKAGLALLEPDLAKQPGGKEQVSKGKVLLGTVKGDLHDIGKGLVALMLEISGYQVHDLGVDVSAEEFVAKAKDIEPDVVGLSSLLTSTAPYMRTTIQALTVAAIRNRCLVIIGGAATTSTFADQIGADGWAEDASGAVRLVDKLIPARSS